MWPSRHKLERHSHWWYDKGAHPVRGVDAFAGRLQQSHSVDSGREAGLAIGRLVAVDDTLASRLVQAPSCDRESGLRARLVAFVNGLADAADGGLDGALDFLVAQMRFLVSANPLLLRFNVCQCCSKRHVLPIQTKNNTTMRPGKPGNDSDQQSGWAQDTSILTALRRRPSFSQKEMALSFAAERLTVSLNKPLRLAHCFASVSNDFPMPSPWKR